MTEQERVDEILRMAERYKMDEGRRRLPMVEAAEMGPGDEYAHLNQAQPPVSPYEAQFRPRLSTEQGQGPYPPVPMPRISSPNQELQHPEGYTQWDSGWRDPVGVPARYVSPSAGEMARDVSDAMLPGSGSVIGSFQKGLKNLEAGAQNVGVPPSTLGMKLFGASVMGGLKQAPSSLIEMAKEYQDNLGEYVRRSGEALGRGSTAALNLGRKVGEWGKTPIIDQSADKAARAALMLQMMQDYMRGREPPEQPIAMGIRG